MKLRVTEIAEDHILSYHNQTHLIVTFSDKTEMSMRQDQFDAIREHNFDGRG